MCWSKLTGLVGGRKLDGVSAGPSVGLERGDARSRRARRTPTTISASASGRGRRLPAGSSQARGVNPIRCRTGRPPGTRGRPEGRRPAPSGRAAATQRARISSRQRFAEVLGDHPLIPAVALAVELGSAEHLAEPSRHALRDGRGPCWRTAAPAADPRGRASRRRCGVIRVKRGEPAAPLEQRRLAVRVRHRVLEVHVPVHPAAERLVLGVPAAAQRVVLERRARRRA